MIEDHLSVLEQLFTFVAGGRELMVSYVKELHAALLRHVATHTVKDSFGNLSERQLVKGSFKTLPNNPSRADGSVHQYCPPEHVDAEMGALIRLYRGHRNVPPEIEAAWLHHRFTQIHPFADGNGRVARAIASAVLIRAGLFPFLITREMAPAYIGTLERADAEDLSPLVRLIISAQREAVVEAVHAIPPIPDKLQVQLDSIQPTTVEQQIEAARLKMIVGGQLKFGRTNWEGSREAVQQLRLIALRRMAEVVHQIQVQIGPAGGWQFAQPGLTMHFVSGDKRLVIHLEFEDVGPQFRGFVLAKMKFTNGQSTQPITDEDFQINYREDIDSIKSRFLP